MPLWFIKQAGDDAILKTLMPVEIGNFNSHVRSALPEKFFDYMLQRHQWFHQEASASCYRDPRWTAPEASYLLGHMERVLGESELRKVAKLCALRCEDVLHNAKNCNYVKVYAKNLVITAHRVQSPRQMVQHAESRKQAAVANKFLNGYVLEGTLSAPLPSIEGAEEIQVYLLHGWALDARSNEKKFFMQFAVPDAQVEEYCWECSFQQLKQEYLADKRVAKEKTSAVSDAVRPRIKKDKKKEGEG